MEILFTPLFRRFVKKQVLLFQVVIQDEVDRICANPEIGESKRGDLTGFWVHKFKFKKQEYLMAYEATEKSLIFYMIDAHENFYRDLKNYLSEV